MSYLPQVLPPTGPGSDTSAIHDNESSEISAITAKATPTSSDFLIIEDAASSNVKKSITIGNLPGGAGGGDSFMEWAGL